MTNNKNVFIKGLKVERGRINSKTLLLEKEPDRTMDNNIPVLKMLVETKKVHYLNKYFNTDFNFYLAKNTI